MTTLQEKLLFILGLSHQNAVQFNKGTNQIPPIPAYLFMFLPNKSFSGCFIVILQTYMPVYMCKLYMLTLKLIFDTETIGYNGGIIEDAKTTDYQNLHSDPILKCLKDFKRAKTGVYRYGIKIKRLSPLIKLMNDFLNSLHTNSLASKHTIIGVLHV